MSNNYLSTQRLAQFCNPTDDGSAYVLCVKTPCAGKKGQKEDSLVKVPRTDELDRWLEELAAKGNNNPHFLVRHLAGDAFDVKLPKVQPPVKKSEAELTAEPDWRDTVQVVRYLERLGELGEDKGEG